MGRSLRTHEKRLRWGATTRMFNGLASGPIEGEKLQRYRPREREKGGHDIQFYSKSALASLCGKIMDPLARFRALRGVSRRACPSSRRPAYAPRIRPGRPRPARSIGMDRAALSGGCGSFEEILGAGQRPVPLTVQHVAVIAFVLGRAAALGGRHQG